MSKILITGGAGFIGSCLAEKLAEKPENTIDFGVTAIASVISAGPKLIGSPPKSSKIEAPQRKIVQILLDSGSDGDLMFHERGTHKFFPYSTRNCLNLGKSEMEPSPQMGREAFK